MMTWITENLGTIIVSVLLIAIVAAAICSLIGNKKKGKSSCGCDCGHCGMSGSCHKH